MSEVAATGMNAANSSGYASPTSVINPKSQLDKNSFLQLLVAQLKNQDPLQPMDSTQFISQLAQFSALEQMSNVAEGQERAATATEMQAAAEWIGKRISYLDDKGNIQSGVAQAMQLKDGLVYLDLGGLSVPWSSILGVGDGTDQAGGGTGV